MKRLLPRIFLLLGILFLSAALVAGCVFAPSTEETFQPQKEPSGAELPVESEKDGSSENSDSEKEKDEEAAGKAVEAGAVEEGRNSGGKKVIDTGPGEKPGTVYIAIEGPADVGMILETTEVELEENDTVLDVLQRITRKKRIQMEYRGRGSNAYLEGIDNLYEFDRGPESGWIYSVNGYLPGRSSGAWTVEAGDHIEWFYTEKMGRDLGIGQGGEEPGVENE